MSESTNKNLANNEPNMLKNGSNETMFAQNDTNETDISSKEFVDELCRKSDSVDSLISFQLLSIIPTIIKSSIRKEEPST